MSAAETPEKAEANMYTEVDCLCAEMAPQEKEWDQETLVKKIGQYLRKTGKAAGTSGAWPEIVERFAQKYYELLCSACYDRPWLDSTDFTIPLASAIKAYCLPPGALNDVSVEEFMQCVAQQCTIAHDGARYYAHAWEVIKTVVPNKTAQKKVREAVDAAREHIVKQMVGSVDMFLTSWIQKSIEDLATASFKQNPKASLVQADAVRLFNELVQEGCGIPLWLEQLNGGKPRPGCPEIDNACALAYQPHPDLPPRQPKGGGKDGYGAWGGVSTGNPQLDAWSMAVQAYGGFGAAGGWGGATGHSPY